MIHRSSAVHIPLPPAPGLLAFLGRFARNCTPRRWAAALDSLQPGRGYSFCVPARQLPVGPLYLPAHRLACTPLPGGGLRVAGVMEFQAPQAPPDRVRSARMARELGELLVGVDPAHRTQEWVGARPCTPDGLPVIGPTRSPRIFVAGGHGMWGITLGPATGQLLAETVLTGHPAPELAPFDPLRRP